MAGKELIAGIFAAMMFVAPAFAQEDMDDSAASMETSEKRGPHFRPYVTVKDIVVAKKERTITQQEATFWSDAVVVIEEYDGEPPTITRESGTFNIMANKAYPYGAEIYIPQGARCRIEFARNPSTYMIVDGKDVPARFTPRLTDTFSKLEIDVKEGDYSIFVSTTFQSGQVAVKTPLGSFESLIGHFKMNVGSGFTSDEAKTPNANEFTFSANGTAVYRGLHYMASEIVANNAFTTQNKLSKQTRRSVNGPHRSLLPEAKNNEVVLGVNTTNLTLPMDGAGNAIPFTLTEGTTVSFTRVKPVGGENWIVHCITRYGNGKAQNMFAYVEGRTDPAFATGELVKPDKPAPTAEEGEDGDADADGDAIIDDESADGAADDGDDFGDDFGDDLGDDFDDDFGDDFGDDIL